MSEKRVQTIKDIARLANVSKSTVSRALNNSPLISQDTRDRIQAIAQEHNFRVNAPARNLSLRQSHTIALVTPDCGPDFFAAESLFGYEILGGIGSGLRTLGYDLLIVHASSRDNSWVNSYFDSARVDGFILLSSHTSQSLVKKLLAQNAPFIAWGVPLPNFRYCTVTGDNITGGTLAAQHLIQMGRQQIAFIGGPPDDLTVQHRYAGYASALQAAGRSVELQNVVYGDYSHASGIVAMQRLLEQAPTLDAVFANSDLMAVAAIKVIKASGKQVPEDIAVVGYDDVSIAMYNSLPLTTIRQNISLAGWLLAQNLIQHIQTGVVTNVTTPVELVIRESA
ncbi:MAG: LacI family DNA-binding transcriptional regulator [Anaerolineaceae bacterium]|nr:LacI family DNA-binding transcriptional regulator [Anaerolineaceae bacterium]